MAFDSSELSKKVQSEIDEILKKFEPKIQQANRSTFTDKFINRFFQRLPIVLAGLAMQIIAELMLENVSGSGK